MDLKNVCKSAILCAMALACTDLENSLKHKLFHDVYTILKRSQFQKHWTG